MARGVAAGEAWRARYRRGPAQQPGRAVSRPEEIHSGREVLCGRSRRLPQGAAGNNHLRATISNNLGELYRAEGKIEPAAALFEEAIAALERSPGGATIQLAPVLNNLAELHRAAGRLEQAEPLYRRAMHLLEKALGPTNAQVAVVCNNLGGLLMDANRLKEAQAAFERALMILHGELGEGHPQVAQVMMNCAAALRRRASALEARARATLEQHGSSSGQDIQR
ncbi:MAG: tetratricopeptide repeat protein [Bryobacterales bacterium]|nr:tetratricopeptide repeat protein [Bryobacterales bacterium]